MWALKDWVANWGWNVFTLMDQITSHVFILGCVKVIIQHLCQQHWCTLSVLINVWSNEKSALFRFCMAEILLMISAVFTLGYSDGTLTHHFTICPSTNMKRCGFRLCSIVPLFLSCSPTCLSLLEQRKLLPATYTIKWRLMKLYHWPGQIAGCRGWRS